MSHHAQIFRPGIEEAPDDGQEYTRKNKAWTVATGGGGGGSYAEAANFAALPSAAANSGVTYLVRAAQGVFFINRKPAGLYRSDGVNWTRLADESEAYFQDTLAWSNITSKPATFPPTIGAGAGDAVAGNDARLTNARAPTAHAASHTNGTDDIQNATASQKGLATAAQITKLDSLSRFAGIVTESTTARVLAVADAGKWIRCTNASPVTVDVAPQSSETWADDTEIFIEQAGAGQVTIAPGSGVTLNSSLTLKTLEQYSVIGLKRVAADVWTVFGEREE